MTGGGQGSGGALGRWLAQLRDPALAACALLTAILLVLLRWPSLPHGAWLVGLLHLALLAIVLAVLLRRRSLVARSGAKGFWRDLFWAVTIWMAADLLLAIGEALPLPELSVLARSGGGVAWLAVWLAAAQNPHRRGQWRPRKVERRLHTAGAAVVMIGSTAYVVGPPLLVRGVDAAFRATWLVLAVFALLVLGRLVYLVFDARDDRWRGVYGALAAAAAFTGWGHVDALLGPEPQASAVLGGPWSAVTLTLLVAAARLDQVYADEETGADVGDPIEEAPLQLEAPYLALAITVPLIHYAGARAGFFDPALEFLHERVMLVWAVALAMVSVYQQRRLEKWARRTLEERGRLERSLQSSRRRLQMMEEREKTEDAMQRTKQIYTKAFRGSPWAVVLTSRQDGRHIEANDHYLEAIGYARDEVIDRTTLELGIWSVAEEREAMLEELAKTGAVRAFELTFRRKDGAERPAIVSAELVEVDGRDCLLSVSRDLGDVRQAQRRQRRVTAILENLPHAVWRLDLDDRVLAANAAAGQLAGAPGELPAFADATDPVDPESSAEWRRARRAAARHGRWHGELSVRADGRRRVSPACLTPIRDADGRPMGLLLFLRLDA